MFRFEEPMFLYALVIIPVLILLYVLIFAWSKRGLNRFGQQQTLSRIIPHWSLWRRHGKFALLCAATALFFIAGANPQWGSKKEKIKAESADFFIALDISQSMMAEDISPSRLDRAKRFAQRLIEALKGDRIGLIFFAGNAYLQIPLTLDYAAAELFVQAADPKQAGTQGTAIAEAINMADQNFTDGESRQRAMILITDGEDHDEDALARARQARNNGLTLFVVGIGTEDGGFVPYIDRGREQYKKDEQGNPVRSRLNVELIRELSEAGGGSSYLIQEGDAIIADLKQRLERIEKQDIEQRSFSEFASYFQYFLLVGILLLALEWLISERSRWQWTATGIQTSKGS